MLSIQQVMQNLASGQNFMRAENFAIACALLCIVASGCSFGRNSGWGSEDFLTNTHSDSTPVTSKGRTSQADVVANNTVVETVNEPQHIDPNLIQKFSPQPQQRAGSIAPEQPNQQISQQQQQQQQTTNHSPTAVNHNQYNRIEQASIQTHLSIAAQAEYLEALTRAGITDPVERAEILESLAGMTSEGRKTFFKMFNMTRKGQSDESTRPTVLSTSREAEMSPKTHDRFTRNSTNRQQQISNGFEQTPSGPKPRVELARNFEGYNDHQLERFDNPLRNASKLVGQGNLLRKANEQDHAADLLRAANQQAVIQASFEEDTHGYDWDQKGNPSTSNQHDPSESGLSKKSLNDRLLSDAISQAENDLSNDPTSSNALSQQIRLRFLYAIAGKRDQALEPIPGMSRAQQEFLNQQVFGLAAMMPSDKPISFSRRSSIAAEHFRIAAEQLGQSAGLQVKNPTLCTEIKGFGDYKKFETEPFRASQDVLLYAELENFHTESTADGFHTHFDARYQILDARGQKVAEHDLKQVSENASSRRRDYFVSYFTQLPSTLMSGEYTLKLIVEDLNSGLFGENSLKFQVGQSSPPLPMVQR